jgi:hypothetical protein
MSVTILYNGVRKTIKTTPNTLIQQIVEEAAAFWKLDPVRCSLKHKKTAVDRKIESLEQNLSKFETALNPQKDPIVARTMSMLKNKYTPVNINPGYADDLMTFFKKINDPPKWRVMTS